MVGDLCRLQLFLYTVIKWKQKLTLTDMPHIGAQRVNQLRAFFPINPKPTVVGVSFSIYISIQCVCFSPPIRSQISLDQVQTKTHTGGHTFKCR